LLGRIETDETVLRVGRKTLRVVAKEFGYRHEGYSRHLERLMVDFGAECSFEKSSKRLLLHHNISVSASSLRKVTLRHARGMHVLNEHNETHGALHKQGAQFITTEMDGSMIPIVEFEQNNECDRRKNRCCSWEEIRLCASREHGSNDTFYGVSYGSVEQAGITWSASVAKANWGLNTYLHVVCDGAVWIHEQCKQCLGKQAHFLIDFYHVCDYLAHATPKAATHPRWFEVQKNRLKDNHPQRVLNALEPYVEEQHIDETNAPVRAAHRYLSNRIEYLDYKTALENELPIGSGMIEGGHRHVLQSRLKISGAWWKRENAAHMAALRVTRANNEDHIYWSQLKNAA
jgi:hypothetical protein